MFRKRNKPVPIGAGFFVQIPSVLLWGLLGGTLLLHAQIELPDVPDSEQDEAQGTHGGSSAEEVPEEPDAAELQRIIQGIQRRQQHFQGEVNPQEEPMEGMERFQAQLAKFEDAPARLMLRVKLRNGKWLQGEAVNLSFLVNTPAGDFPVILHELVSIQREAEEERLVFEFQDGDRLKGSAGKLWLNLTLASGGGRMLGPGEWSSVLVQEKLP